MITLFNGRYVLYNCLPVCLIILWMFCTCCSRILRKEIPVRKINEIERTEGQSLQSDLQVTTPGVLYFIFNDLLWSCNSTGIYLIYFITYRKLHFKCTHDIVVLGFLMWNSWYTYWIQIIRCEICSYLWYLINTSLFGISLSAYLKLTYITVYINIFRTGHLKWK